MLNELDVLKDVAFRLDKYSIEYMLTGSLAMNYYAEPRMTRDIDIVVQLLDSDAAAVFGVFEKDYYLSEEAMMSAIRNRRMFNLIHNESVIKVDFIVKKSDEYSLLAFSRKTAVGIDGTNLWIICKEDLILSKLAWMRDSKSAVQARDIKNLLSTGCDQKYIDTWLPKLGLVEIYRGIL